MYRHLNEDRAYLLDCGRENFSSTEKSKPLKDSNYLRTDAEGSFSRHIPGKELTSNRIHEKYLQLNGNFLHTFCVCCA